MKYTLEQRKVMKSKLLETLQQNDGSEVRKVLAGFCNQTGMRLETVEKMLRELTLAGVVIIENGYIKLPEFKEVE